MSTKGTSKFNHLKEDVLIEHNQNPTLSFNKIAKRIAESRPNEELNVSYLRQWIGVIIKEQEHPALSKECEKVGIDINTVGNYWYKGKSFSIHAKNKGKTYEDFREELIEELNEYSPNFEKIKREPVKDGHLLVIDMADLHFGKLCKEIETGEEYNLEVTRARTIKGVEGLLQKASGFNLDKIMLVIGNDMLHVDNTKGTTTGGTHQDMDGTWYDAFTKAKQTLIDSIEILLPIADIHLHYDPSNHDSMSGFMLADSIFSWFRNNEQMTFNFAPSPRKYFKYHKSLIGTAHGHGVKWKDLPSLMAMEAKKDWADTDHKYFYTHHVHHKQVTDFIGVTVESLRSISSADSWHKLSGYDYAPKALEGFIHSKEYGQIARLSHIF